MLGERVTSDFLPHAHTSHPEITLASGSESRIYFSPVKELQTKILSQLSSPLSNRRLLKVLNCQVSLHSTRLFITMTRSVSPGNLLVGILTLW